MKTITFFGVRKKRRQKVSSTDWQALNPYSATNCQVFFFCSALCVSVLFVFSSFAVVRRGFGRGWCYEEVIATMLNAFGMNNEKLFNTNNKLIL